MSTTPTTPQWAIEAAKEINEWLNRTHYVNIASIIAKHAPSPAAQPTDEAKLRETHQQIYARYGDKLEAICEACHKHSITPLSALDRIVDLLALAPHLSQREPGDSGGEVLRGKLMSAGDLTLLEDQNAIEETGVFVKCSREALRALKGNLVYEEVEIRKSAQRGEGKP